MLTSVGRLTVNVAFPPIEPELAVTVELPTAMPSASPVVLIVAIVGADDFHVTVPETFAVLPSEKVPVATNCWVCPTRIEAVVGVTLMDRNVAALTRRLADPTSPL